MSDPLRLGFIDAGDLAKDAARNRAARSEALLEIGPAPERLAARRQEHGHGPAALLAEQLQRAHIDMVHVRPLLAIDLDIDEELVHDGRYIRIFEALVGHHVTPVARGIADREQHRTVEPPRLGEGVWAPFPPFDRVVAMLEQIRRTGLAQAVHDCCPDVIRSEPTARTDLRIKQKPVEGSRIPSA